MTTISIKQTQNPLILKFEFPDFITNNESFEFKNIDETKSSPLAKELFFLPFVKTVYISGNFIAIERYSIVEWEDVQDAVAEQIQNYVANGGKIINIASMLSFQGGVRVPSYTASKSGVMGITRALSNEWAKHGINVNAIAPGYMATNNTAALQADPVRNAAILDRIPAGRWGTPADLAGPVVFLASAASDYVNGYTVAVDGGWLAR